MTTYVGNDMIQFGQQNTATSHIYAGTPQSYVIHGMCRASATDKEWILADFNSYVPLSNKTRYECLELQYENVKSFVGASADLTLHVDLLSGTQQLLVADLFAPVNLKAVITATETAQGTSAPLINSADSLGIYYIKPIIDGNIASDGDVKLTADLRYTPLDRAYKSHLGMNDKNLVNQKFADATARTGFMASSGFPNMLNLVSTTTYSHLLRFRITSTSALVNSGKTLVIKVNAYTTNSNIS